MMALVSLEEDTDAAHQRVARVVQEVESLVKEVETCQCQTWILLAVESQARDAARVRVVREVIEVVDMEDTAVSFLAKQVEDTEVTYPDHPRVVSQNDVAVIVHSVARLEVMVVSFLVKQVTVTEDTVENILAVESRVRDRQRAAARVRAARDQVMVTVDMVGIRASVFVCNIGEE